MLGFLKKIKRDRIIKTLLKEKEAQKAKKTKSAKSAKEVSCDSIKSIGFAYIIDSHQSYNDLLAIVDEIKNTCYSYNGIILEKKKGIIDESHLNDNNIIIIKKDELNFIGIPQSEEFNSFITKQNDVFISFNFTSNFTLDYIALKSNTAFTVGLSESRLPVYTMVIHGTTASLSNKNQYVEQILNYLKILYK